MSGPLRDDDNNEYLWSKTGEVDPDAARLEALLGRLGQTSPPPPLGFAIEIPRRMRPLAAMAMLAAAAVVVLGLVGMVWRYTRITSAPSLTFVQTFAGGEAGTPAGSAGVSREGTLKIGGWLDTSKSTATIEIADIGRVDVEQGSRLSLLSTKPGDYRLHLERGTMHALIWAPPGQFFVETPSSTAVDLGCAYTLSVDDNGDGLVRVSSGWVGFEWRGRESFIPMGAVCRTKKGRGPGTPHYEDAAERFRGSLDAIDFGEGLTRTMALDTALESARERDAMSLWHLLSSVPPADRDRVFDALAKFVPPPGDVTRDGIRAGRRDMLDAWWNKLGLDTASWWRTWKQQWRGVKGDEK
jgi:hypothetical protein